MDYGEVLTKAWRIIWKHKVLWIFGILVSCGQGGGSGNPGGNANTGVQYSGNGGNLPPEMERFFWSFERFFEQIEAWQVVGVVAAIILFIILLSLLFLALSTVGRIGLIQGTVQADAGLERLTFSELFESGKPYFWRILIFNFLIGLAGVLLVILLMLPLLAIAALTFGIGLLCLLPLLCLLVPVSWVISVIIEQANIAIVVEDLDMLAGLKRGWEVFRQEIGTMIVMALILLLGGGLVSMLLALPMIFTVFPLMMGMMGTAMSDGFGWFGGGVLIAILCFFSYLPFLLILSGILQAYIKSAWTLTYLRVTNKAASDIVEAESLPQDL